MEATIKNQSDNPNKKEKYILFAYRWIIFISMAFVCFFNGATFTFFTSVATKCSNVYSISLTIFSINNFLYMLMYPISSLLFAGFINKKFGMRISITSGLICLLLCDWLRTQINSEWNKYFILITCSGFFGGISQPFIMNSYTEIASNWFSTTERVVVTSLFAILGPIGGAAGLAFPLIIMGDVTYMTNEEFKEKLEFSLYLFAILASVFFVLNMILMREKPETPPTKSAEKSQKSEENPEESSFKKLFTNTNFLIEAMIFMVFYGTICIVSISIEMVLNQFGVLPNQSSIIGVAFTASGLLSAFVVSLILSKTNSYKFFAILISIVSFVGYSLIMLCSYNLWINFAYFSSILFGFGILPTVAVCYQFGCEVAYPVNPSLISGFQLSASQAYALVVSFAVTQILPSGDEPPNPTKGLICAGILLGGMVIGVICSLIVKQDLRRLRVDRRKSSLGDNLLMRTSIIEA